MQTLLKNDLSHLLAVRHNGPFVSIYLEANPVINDLTHQKLALRQALKTAQIQFNQHFSAEEWLPIQNQLQPLLADNDFWLSPTSRWLGIIANADQHFTFGINTPVKHQVNVASVPTILPIIQDRQQNFDYDLLCLNEDSFEIYQKSNADFEPFKFPDKAPTTLKVALGDELRGGELNFHAGPSAGANHQASYHGHNAKAEEQSIDHRNYYQVIDQYLLTHLSQKTQRPMIICGLPQNQALFREISKNPYLLHHLKIEKSPTGLSQSELGTLAEPLQKQWQAEITGALLEQFDSAQSRNLVISDPWMLVTPATSGRIQTLLVAEDTRIDGTIADDGTTIIKGDDTPDNLVDDLADIVLAKGGQVRIIPADQSPVKSGIVGLLRY